MGQTFQGRLAKFGVLVYRPECGDKAIYEYQVLGDQEEISDDAQDAALMQ